MEIKIWKDTHQNQMNGLTKKQVETRIKEKNVNYDLSLPSKSIKQILYENFFTLFNFLNLFLAIIIFMVGSYKNMLFLAIVIINTSISTIQEIHSKKIIDKLSVLAESKANVIRDSKKIEISIDEIVLDDIIEFKAGNQVATDSIIQDGEVLVNESFISGEPNSITKKTGDMILFVVGVLLLLASQGVINFEIIMKLVFPTILVIIGLSCIIKGIVGTDFREKVKEIKCDDKDTLKCDAVFSGQKLTVENSILGADVNAIFGGLELDLRKAKLKKDIVITASSVFGGIDILLPDDVNLELNPTCIFGGVDDKSKKNKDAKATIYLNATCVFGGIDIK